MTTTFNQGDRVYLLDGAECQFVAHVGDKIVVRKVYSIDDEETEEEREDLGEEVLVREVFASPPTPKRHADVIKLEQALADLHTKLFEARREERELAQKQKERAALLEEHKAVARIVDFIQGKITHFATRSYGEVRVLTRDEALRYVENDMGGRSHPWDGHTLKLLTLYGHDYRDHRRGRGLSWRLHQYSDGGGSMEVMPCQSREEAIELARGWLAEVFAKPLGYRPEVSIANAEALGLPVPEAFREAVRALRIAEATSAVATHEAQLTASRAKLAALTGEA